MGWLWIVVGGVFETAFAISLKASEGFTRPFWAVSFLVTVSLSMYFLHLGMRTIPVGTAYAAWTGIGAVGTVVLGIALYGDPVSLWRMVFVFTLIGSIVGLNLVA